MLGKEPSTEKGVLLAPHRPDFCSRCGGQLVPVKHVTLAFPSSRALTSRSPLSPRKGGPDIRDTGAPRHPLERLLCAHTFRWMFHWIPLDFLLPVPVSSFRGSLPPPN